MNGEIASSSAVLTTGTESELKGTNLYYTPSKIVRSADSLLKHVLIVLTGPSVSVYSTRLGIGNLLRWIFSMDKESIYVSSDQV